jgi:hypothetical protein
MLFVEVSISEAFNPLMTSAIQREKHTIQNMNSLDLRIGKSLIFMWVLVPVRLLGPDSQQEIAFVNLAPRSRTGTFF